MDSSVCAGDDWLSELEMCDSSTKLGSIAPVAFELRLFCNRNGADVCSVGGGGERNARSISVSDFWFCLSMAREKLW